MIALWLALFALVSLPHAHHLLHTDADSPAHECLITAFAKGQLWLGTLVCATLIPLVVCVGAAPLARLILPPRRDWRFAPSRAPPVPASFLVVAG